MFEYNTFKYKFDKYYIYKLMYNEQPILQIKPTNEIGYLLEYIYFNTVNEYIITIYSKYLSTEKNYIFQLYIINIHNLNILFSYSFYKIYYDKYRFYTHKFIIYNDEIII